jgi:hypothetical protein
LCVYGGSQWGFGSVFTHHRWNLTKIKFLNIFYVVNKN